MSIISDSSIQVKIDQSISLYKEIYQQIEVAKSENIKMIVIEPPYAMSLSVDSLHRWFPTYTIGWNPSNNIFIKLTD